MAQAPRDTLGTRLQIELTPTQLATLDEFQRTENLPSRTATLNLLLEIAFETVTSAGQRFWDKPFPIVRDLYRSSNGDVWQLLHDPASGQMMVRHTPNAASGGQVRETSIESFLRGGRRSAAACLTESVERRSGCGREPAGTIVTRPATRLSGTGWPDTSGGDGDRCRQPASIR